MFLIVEDHNYTARPQFIGVRGQPLALKIEESLSYENVCRIERTHF